MQILCFWAESCLFMYSLRDYPSVYWIYENVHWYLLQNVLLCHYSMCDWYLSILCGLPHDDTHLLINNFFIHLKPHPCSASLCSLNCSLWHSSCE